MSSSWQNLPLDLKERVAAGLPRNWATQLRCVDKTTAAQFKDHPRYSVIKLSEPVPHQLFAAHWKRHATGLPLERRKRLLALTAASGDLNNLELAWSICSCPLPMEVMDLAAAANRPQILGWLRSQNCPWGGLSGVGATVTPDTVTWLTHAGCPLQPVRLLKDAAAGGNDALVAWLVRDGGLAATFIDEGVVAAARGGHVGILDSLLARRQQQLQPQTLGQPQHQQPRLHDGGRMAEGDGLVGGGDSSSSFTRVGELLAAAAEGCGLEVLQRLHATFVGQPDQVCATWRGETVAAAAGSATPDWAAKLEW